jgi:hypothetical protein
MPEPGGKSSFAEGFFGGRETFGVELFAMTLNPASDSDKKGIGKRETFPN